MTHLPYRKNLSLDILNLTLRCQKMPYAQRNADGEIIALTAQPADDNDVLLMPDDPEVLLFLSRSEGDAFGRTRQNLELLADDLKMIRVVEDLIDLLTAKGVILFSELPSAVQEKILRKKIKREQLSSGNDILVIDSHLL